MAAAVILWWWLVADRNSLRSKIELGDVGAFWTAAGGLKTEDFSGEPRSGSSARGLICFGEERGVMIE